MRLIQFLLIFKLVLAFDEDDYQIFKITDTLRDVIGPDANFYSALEVTQDADERQITKNYRKKSLEHHPDKSSSEESAKIYKALTSIVSILKNTKLRAKYDKHLKKGLPKWRGTDYYYDFFEPGIIFIVSFILAAVSVAQYIILWIFYRRKIQFVKERNEETNKMSMHQVKRELARIEKEEGVVFAFTKQELREKPPGEILGLLDMPPRPSILDLYLCSVFISSYQRLTRRNKTD